MNIEMSLADMCALCRPLNKKCNILNVMIGAAGAQWRRIRANSEMHLTVLSRVEDECGEFSSTV